MAKSLKTGKLEDGTELFCLSRTEAIVLDSHVDGYYQHGVAIKDGDTVMDVGANIGIFGVRACQRYPNVKVYAFEPIPDIFEVLQANADKYGKGRFFPMAYGVSETEGSATFTYFPNSPALSTAHGEMWNKDPDMFVNAVKGSLNDAPKGFRWARFLPRFAVRMIANYLRSGAKKFECKLIPISKVIADNNIARIDLLKIDCEGAEILALKSIAASDWDKIQQVVVEIHDTDGRLDFAINLLKEKGFTKINTETEKALEKTNLINVYAVR
jgi:FkbM family methyltransferase